MQGITVKRDVNGEMRRLIDDALDRNEPGYIPAVLAVNIVEQLQREDPELLNKWLITQATRIVREAIVAVERYHKQVAKSVSESPSGTKSVFTGALERYEKSKDPRVLSAWLSTTYVVNVQNQRRPLGDMTQDDLGYAAESHQKLSRSNAMQAAFLRVLAGKVGAKTVREVYSEQELAEAWRRLDL